MRKLVGVMAVALLAGCASTPSGPRQIPAAPVTEQTAKTLPQALKNATPIVLTANKAYRHPLDKTSPTLEIFDSSVYYAIFELPSGRPAVLHLKTLCSCLGFSKSIIPPIAFLLDANGNEVGDPLTFKSYPANWDLPVHYGANVPPSDIPDTAKYLIVTADPRLLRGGKTPSSEATMVMPGVYPAVIPMVIPISIGFAITGPIWVRYEVTK